ncbi:MAG: hypothetical protein AB1700_00525 [Bacillota bacterium]
MPRPEERDLFDVFAEWGYEVRVVTPEVFAGMAPGERLKLLQEVKEIDPDAAEELVKCLLQS